MIYTLQRAQFSLIPSIFFRLRCSVNPPCYSVDVRAHVFVEAHLLSLCFWPDKMNLGHFEGVFEESSGETLWFKKRALRVKTP